MSDLGFEEELIKEIRQDFLEDLKDRLSEMNRSLVEMERGGILPAPLKEVFRHSHNIKGTSATLGLLEISSVAHRIEDFLSLLVSEEKNDFKPYLAEIFKLLDFMEEQRRLYQKGTAPDEMHRITLARLQTRKKRKLNILILENSKSFKNIIKSALQKEGLEPSLAQSSLEALNRALTEPVDLFITSQEHPVIDGLSLILMLKANPEKAGLYTILLTSDKILSPIPDKIVPKDKNFLQSILAVIRELESR